MKYLALTLAILVMFSGCTNQTGQNNAATTTNPTQAGDTGSAQAKTFKITAENYKFVMDGVDNPDIRVKQGDRVRIELTITDGLHDWGVDEFNAKTEKVNAGRSTSVEFTTDKKGTFEYYCSVMQHRQMGMKGNLTVE